MGGRGHAASTAASRTDLHGLGRMSLSDNPKASLLIVFGGIPVDFHDKDGAKTPSGVF
jgi:hypothetical protein